MDEKKYLKEKFAPPPIYIPSKKEPEYYWEPWKELTDNTKANQENSEPTALDKTFYNTIDIAIKEPGKSRYIFDFWYAFKEFDFVKDISGCIKGLDGFKEFQKGMENDDNYKLLSGMGKMLSAAGCPFGDVTYGYTEYSKSFNDLFQGKVTEWKAVGAGFKMFSGLLRMGAGGLKITEVGAPLAVPLGLLSATFATAALYFERGDVLGGVLSILIGGILTGLVSFAIKAVLKKACQALMKLIMNAFNLSATPLAANPFTAVAGLAIIVLISITLELALSKLFSIVGLAEGGFPATSQPFIAREAGPELVGTMNGRNAVVNNEQIVEAVSVGVFNAWKAAWRDNGSNGPAIARVLFDGQCIAMARQT